MADITTCFLPEHIHKHAFNSSAELAEQAVYCLELVRELSESGLEFQFKGGNSLLLVLEEPQRFSIDVDIATDENLETIEKKLDGIVSRYGRFMRWIKRQHKTKPWIPLSSYYLFYSSVVAPGEDTSIMLDVQLHLSPYASEKKPIVCGDLYRSKTTVDLPLPASLIGDKLLTLGPETLGIPVGKGKSAQRLKHFFDVSRLLGMSPKLRDIRESFTNCLDFENRLQKRDISVEDVIHDTLASCYAAVPHVVPPHSGDETAVLQEHVGGLEPFAEHLFRKCYTWEDLQIDTARVACCIAAVESEDVSETEFNRIFNDTRYTAPVRRGDVLPQNSLARRYWEFILSWKRCGEFVRENLMR
jgi:hypothetical protein